MKKVWTTALFHYEIVGENEAKAAKELEQRLDFLSRCYHIQGESYLEEKRGIVEDTAKKYDVQIKAVI